MKFLYFDNYRLGVLKGDTVVDITDLTRSLPHRDTRDLIVGLIENYVGFEQAIRHTVNALDGVPLRSVTLRPPLPRVRQIDCMATNYMEDGTLAEPFAINAFHKSPSSIIGPHETMELADVAATCFEAEAELAVVIGKRASHVSEDEAADHIFGYMNFIDGSARGLPPSGNTFFQAKSRDTFAPMGPYLVTADELPCPQALGIRLWINGESRQAFSTSDMAHPIAKCISWLSTIHVLEPGDIVATGTNHRGLSALHDGDMVELEVDGLGRLMVHVRDDLQRGWTRETRAQGNALRVAQGLDPLPTGVVPRQVSGKYVDA